MPAEKAPDDAMAVDPPADKVAKATEEAKPVDPIAALRTGAAALFVSPVCLLERYPNPRVAPYVGRPEGGDRFH